MGRAKPQTDKLPEERLAHIKASPESHKGAYDAALTTLFANSLGPVKPNIRSIDQPKSILGHQEPANKATNSNEAEVIEQDAVFDMSNEEEGEEDSPQLKHSSPKFSSTFEKHRPNLKRKRKNIEDDLEGGYMNELATQQFEDEKKARRIQKKRREQHHSHTTTGDACAPGSGDISASESVESASRDDKDTSAPDIPQHESIVNRKEGLDLEESSRTVFLANVSTIAIKSKNAKKTLMNHLVSFTSTLPELATKHTIESLRFRSTAYATTGIPRKAAYAKKELMDTTTKSTNAYAVYTTQVAAREAARKLNGTMVLDRHLRVDSVAHPAKIDHRRCVFIGNLGFVDDMSNMDAAEDEDNNKRPRKGKESADIEEGLWRQFGKVGAVESVRVVRDQTTRVGKGFAYVQFKNTNAVEAALLYNGKKFPPMLPRILRVTRAKNIKKASSPKESGTTIKRKHATGASYKPKMPTGVQSLIGRAGKLLGRAGAAQLRAAGEQSGPRTKKVSGIAKTPESIIFEGYRASSHQGKAVLRSKASSKKHGKPSVRSRKFKVQGKKKAGS